MLKFEGTPNMNSAELNPNEVSVDVDAEKKLEDELTTEELEKLKVEGGQEAKKPELSPEERIEQIDKDIEDKEEEMTRLSEFIEGTKSALNAAREKLDLPPTEEDPPSVFSEKDKLEKLQVEQDALEEKKEESGSQEDKREGKQESKGEGESLKENDLIVSDDQIEFAKKILEKNEIQYKDREHTKRQVLDAKTELAVPGEFVLTIFDSEHPDRPASFDFVKQVFKLIKDSDIAVRYGKNPERG